MSPVAPPPRNKRTLIIWVLVGVAGFLALMLGIVVAGGRFLMRQAGLAGDSIRVEDASQGTFQVNTAGGSVQVGDTAEIPAWLPKYPGSNAQDSFSAQNSSGQGGTFTFKTKDAPQRVVDYYRGQLQSSGLTVMTVSSHTVTAEDKSKHRSVTIAASNDGAGETAVSITYTTSK